MAFGEKEKSAAFRQILESEALRGCLVEVCQDFPIMSVETNDYQRGIREGRRTVAVDLIQAAFRLEERLGILFLADIVAGKERQWQKQPRRRTPVAQEKAADLPEE